MIEVSFRTDPEGLIREFKVSGHAGYDEPGKDIVCAAVSAVVQTAVIGLTDVAGIRIKPVQRKGLAECRLPENLEEEQRKSADIILKTMMAGLQSIKLGYPSRISIRERKVD
ncbi:MAG: ribosomal-processing cysteine protease Prp [Caldicoprobacterales bacterium]|jgi:uncharacterized protein YsxB (DUF464 family)|nr:ribosomal-processing cysteine protease Prp [Clostridiales bacterium]